VKPWDPELPTQLISGMGLNRGEGRRLGPFACVPNKLLLTTDLSWGNRYRAKLRKHFATQCSVQHPRLKLSTFDDVMLIWSKARWSLEVYAEPTCVMGHAPAEAKYFCIARSLGICKQSH
jgi:hypothetical protein